MFRKVLFTLWCLVALYKANAKPVQMMERGDPEYDEMPGVQFMITRQMRGVLEGKLKYLAEEVDCMQPEIARAVIEKKLGIIVDEVPLDRNVVIVSNCFY